MVAFWPHWLAPQELREQDGSKDQLLDFSYAVGWPLGGGRYVVCRRTHWGRHSIRNHVTQIEPRAAKIVAGDEIIRDEVVRTATDSDARFVFRDDTNLSLGPGSTLKFDRTVFDDPKAGDIAIKLTTGTFRFVTGKSKKESYMITTPTATMGVRGTTVDFKVQDDVTVLFCVQARHGLRAWGSAWI